MVECADRDCRDGLKACINKVHKEVESKVSKRMLGGAIASLVSVVAVFIVYAMAADKAKDIEFHDVKEAQVRVMTKQEIIESNQEKMMKSQQEMSNKQVQLEGQIDSESRRSQKVDDVILKKLNRLLEK